MSTVIARPSKASHKAKVAAPEVAPQRSQSDLFNGLHDSIELAKVYAGTLFGNLVEPRGSCSALDVPGAFEMVSAIPYFLAQAMAQAQELGLNIPEIGFAWGLASQLDEMSHEGSDGRQFNPDDEWIGMCYWAIEKAVGIAFEKASIGGAQ